MLKHYSYYDWILYYPSANMTIKENNDSTILHIACEQQQLRHSQLHHHKRGKSTKKMIKEGPPYVCAFASEENRLIRYFEELLSINLMEPK